MLPRDKSEMVSSLREALERAFANGVLHSLPETEYPWHRESRSAYGASGGALRRMKSGFLISYHCNVLIFAPADGYINSGIPNKYTLGLDDLYALVPADATVRYGREDLSPTVESPGDIILFFGRGAFQPGAWWRLFESEVRTIVREVDDLIFAKRKAEAEAEIRKAEELHEKSRRFAASSRR